MQLNHPLPDRHAPRRRTSRSTVGALTASIGVIVGVVGATTGPVAAVATQHVPLHNDDAPVGTDCPDDGGAYWHFVVTPNNGSSSFASITLDLDGTVVVFPAGEIVPNGTQLDNVFVRVPAGHALDEILTTGSSAAVATASGRPKFVLSHLCPGTATTSSSAPTIPATIATTPTTTPATTTIPATTTPATTTPATTTTTETTTPATTTTTITTTTATTTPATTTPATTIATTTPETTAPTGGSTGLAAISLEMTTSVDVVRPGDELVYTLVAENTGALTLDPVVVYDRLPAEVTYHGDVEIDGDAGTCTLVEAARPQLVRCDLVGAIAAGERTPAVHLLVVVDPALTSTDPIVNAATSFGTYDDAVVGGRWSVERVTTGADCDPSPGEVCDLSAQTVTTVRLPTATATTTPAGQSDPAATVVPGAEGPIATPTAELPTTGSDVSRSLALIGAVLVLLGAAMSLGTRRRPAAG